MADAKISELAAGTAPDGSELVEIVQGGVNVKVTTQDIADLGGGGGGHVIEEEGTPLTQRTKLNFVGAGVAVTDDSVDDASVVTIAGGGTAATQAEMITGSDNTKMATPLAVEEKRSVKSVSLTNGATGTTDIDCGLKQELKVVYNTTVTGNITITKSNDTNLEFLHLTIAITGSNITITWPSDVRMARYNEVASGDGWLQASKILQVSSVGTADLHEFSLVRVGSIFILKYDGPVRA